VEGGIYRNLSATGHLPSCPECNRPIEGGQATTVGVRVEVSGGEEIAGTEQEALFHAACWQRFVEREQRRSGGLG
jgi:hypothetical protein